MNEEERWKARADFWQLKYFELLVHTQQVIGALYGPMLDQLRRNQAAARERAGQPEGMPS